MKKSKKKRKIGSFKQFIINKHMDSSNMPNTAGLPAATGGLQPSLS